MRRYQTRTIPATIRQKNDPTAKFRLKGHQLTAEDFEIVSEHGEEYLTECYCDFCGQHASWIDSEWDASSLVNIALEQCISDDRASFSDVADVFFGEWTPEICERCIRNILAPYLQSLRLCTPAPVPPETTSEDIGVVSESEALVARAHLAQGPLIGEEDEESMPLAPLVDAEPF
jgi:hypothetical protein